MALVSLLLLLLRLQQQYSRAGVWPGCLAMPVIMETTS